MGTGCDGIERRMPRCPAASAARHILIKVEVMTTTVGRGGTGP